MRKNVVITDITEQYVENATPGKGMIKREERFREKDHEDEISVAQILYDNYGGNIILLAEESFRNENPDYKWNNKLWDLKKPIKINNLGKLVQKGLSQIFNNPGIVIDITKLKEPQTKIEQVVKERIQTSMRNSIDIIFIRNSTIIKVYRYKK